jgi:hypothetical protein
VAVVPLTLDQKTAVEELVSDGRLTRVPADLRRAATFMHRASDALLDLPNLGKPQNRHNLAYDACHDVGEALLAAYGLRTTNGVGQHEALGRWLRVVLDTAPGSAAAQHFDRLRRARNQQRYEARPVGEADARVAEKAARDLYEGAIARRLPT